MLTGTEVKSLRAGRASLADGFGQISDHELWLHNVHIPEYAQGTWTNHEPRRTRKLLMHRKEIDKLAAATTRARLDSDPAFAVLQRREGQGRASSGPRQADLRQAPGPGAQGRCQRGRSCLAAAKVAERWAMVRTHNRGAHAGKPAPKAGSPVRGTRARGVRAGNKRVGEARVGGARPRSARARVVAAAVATALLLTGLLLGWASPEPSPEGTVQSFLLAWENGQYDAAAALTTGAPVQVAAALHDAYQQVGAADLTLAMLSVTQRGDIGAGAASTRTSTSAAAARRGSTTVPSGCAGWAPTGRWCGPRPSSFPGCGPGCAWPWSARCRCAPSCWTRREPRFPRPPWSTPSASSPAAWRTRPGPRAAWPA